LKEARAGAESPNLESGTDADTTVNSDYRSAHLALEKNITQDHLSSGGTTQWAEPSYRNH